MKIWLLCEGRTDATVVPVLVEGIARAINHRGTIEWVPVFERCHGLRIDAGPLLRDAGADRAVVVTDAWCNAPSGDHSQRFKSNRDRLVGTTCTAKVRKYLTDSLTLAGIRPHAVGVACAELESWLMASPEAMQAVGRPGAGLNQAPQNDCDAERVDVDAIGSGRLRALLTNYDAGTAKRMATALVSTNQSLATAAANSQSLSDFVDAVKALLQNNVASRPQPPGSAKPKKAKKWGH